MLVIALVQQIVDSKRISTVVTNGWWERYVRARADITSLELSRGAKLTLYADDMLLYKTIASDRDYIELQEGIDKIHDWSQKNLLLTSSKTDENRIVHNYNCCRTTTYMYVST